MREGRPLFSFLTAVVLLVKKRKTIGEKKPKTLTFDRKDPGSYELMSCLASSGGDNPAPS